MRYLDPKNDFIFKKIFGNHSNLLISLLNALLPLAEDEYIETIEYLPAELVPEIPEFKYPIVNVRCIDNFGRQFIVEMQMMWNQSFKARVLFNASKAYIRQLSKAKPYEGLQPVYALNFINHIFQPETEQFYHHYAIVHTENTNERLEGLEFIFVELPKFKPETIAHKKMMILWLRFLTEIKDGNETAPTELIQNDTINEALVLLQETHFTNMEKSMYDKYGITISSESTLINDKTRFAEEAGLKIGMEQGMELIALKMLQKEEPLDKIIEYTGLTQETINRIQQINNL